MDAFDLTYLLTMIPYTWGWIYHRRSWIRWTKIVPLVYLSFIYTRTPGVRDHDDTFLVYLITCFAGDTTLLLSKANRASDIDMPLVVGAITFIIAHNVLQQWFYAKIRYRTALALALFIVGSYAWVVVNFFASGIRDFLSQPWWANLFIVIYIIQLTVSYIMAWYARPKWLRPAAILGIALLFQGDMILILNLVSPQLSSPTSEAISLGFYWLGQYCLFYPLRRR